MRFSLELPFQHAQDSVPGEAIADVSRVARDCLAGMR